MGQAEPRSLELGMVRPMLEPSSPASRATLAGSRSQERGGDRNPGAVPGRMDPLTAKPVF